MSKAALDIVSGCLLGFNILGTFGNLNIIVATARTKALRKKFGILLAILACSDLLCLWYEFQSYVRMTFGLTRAPLISCYWANVGYIFIETFEVYMILAVAVDRLHALQFPIKYKVFTTNIYVVVMISPGLCIGLFFAVVSYALMPPNVIREVCVLPFSMPDKVSTWWNHYNMWGAVVTVLIYCLTYFQLYCFSPFVNDFRKVKKQKAILNTLIVQVVVFFFSSVGAAGIIMVMENMNLSEEILTDGKTLGVIPGLFSYTCNFYVYFWRSKIYRDIFIQQLFCGRLRIDSNDSTAKSVMVVTVKSLEE